MADAVASQPEGSNGGAGARRRLVPIHQIRHFARRRSHYGLTPWLVIGAALSALFDCRRRARGARLLIAIAVAPGVDFQSSVKRWEL